jgi:hypothetical protein
MAAVPEQVLRMPQEKKAQRFQVAGQAFDDPFLQRAIEIDDYIAAENRIEMRWDTPGRAAKPG